MELYLALVFGLIGILIGYFGIKSKVKVYSELEGGIQKETADLRIHSIQEIKGILSVFDSNPQYIKIVQNLNGDWFLKTRGSLKSNSYNIYKFIGTDSDSFSAFKLLKIQIEGEQGKIVIQNRYLNRVKLTFNINSEDDLNVLNECRSDLK